MVGSAEDTDAGGAYPAARRLGVGLLLVLGSMRADGFVMRM